MSDFLLSKLLQTSRNPSYFWNYQSNRDDQKQHKTIVHCRSLLAAITEVCMEAQIHQLLENTVQNDSPC